MWNSLVRGGQQKKKPKIIGQSDQRKTHTQYFEWHTIIATKQLANLKVFRPNKISLDSFDCFISCHFMSTHLK